MTVNSTAPEASQAFHSPSAPPPKQPRIHILGLGNIGRLLAHSLARLSPPPRITLLLHRPDIVSAFKEGDGSINIITDGISNSVAGFEIEMLGIPCHLPIKNLIVATKATHTFAALRQIRGRLIASSSIVFAQNGKGVIEEVTEKLFPDPATRPALLPTVIFHGLTATGPFESVHAGVAHMNIAVPPDRPQARYLLDSIVKAPALHASETSETELLVLQLQKLAINAVLNPLTAIFRVLNGEIVNREVLTPLWTKVAEEAAEVMRAYLEMEGIDARKKFESKVLLEEVRTKTEGVAKNRSSMLQDVEAGKETEVKYINGWIIATGKKLGVSVTVNERVVKCLLEGRTIEVNEAAINQEFGGEKQG